MSDTGPAHDGQDEAGYKCECGEHLHDIIGIVQHLSDCSPVRLTAESLSRKERNTLMYVEGRVVDHGGKLALSQMNYVDQQNLKVFKAAGLLELGPKTRDVHDDGPADPKADIQEVELFADAAWDIVRDARQIRASEDDRVDFSVGVGR